MDPDIRLQLLRDSKQISLKTYDAIKGVIDMLNKDYGVKLTEDNGSMLLTHLVIACERIILGKPVEGLDYSIYGEIKDARWLKVAEKACEKLEAETGIDFPEGEKRFVLLYLYLLFEKEKPEGVR